MFDFGKNWRNYSKSLTKTEFDEAIKSLEQLFGPRRLSNKSFIDIGCGSGIFSIGAHQLGAKPVIGIDVLPSSIQCSIENAVKYNINDIKFKKLSALDPQITALGKFDIVYAWGSLHHTGDMWQAIDNATKLVHLDGLLMLAIYNKNFMSPFWKIEKWLYHHSPRIIKWLIELFYFILVAPLKILIYRRRFFKKKRGMKFYYDAIDWLGGYPYEYATKSEVIEFLNRRGFKLLKVIPPLGISGCNQFVFQSKGNQ
ncbi:class I SAM-dependent methyltransferase [Patescibacteria group bacterium]